MKRGAVTVLILLSALTLSACGGDGGNETTSPSEWANSVCTDLSEWKSSVASVVASFGGGEHLSQQTVQDAANDVTDATETLVGDLQNLGRPDTEAGEGAENAVNQFADELQTGIGEIQRAAAGVSSAADVAQAVSTARTTLTTLGNQLSSTITGLEQLDPQGELKSAFEQSGVCSDLKSF